MNDRSGRARLLANMHAQIEAGHRAIVEPFSGEAQQPCLAILTSLGARC